MVDNPELNRPGPASDIKFEMATRAMLEVGGELYEKPVAPLLGKGFDEAQIFSDPDFSRALRSALMAFAHVIGLVEPNQGGGCS